MDRDGIFKRLLGAEGEVEIARIKIVRGEQVEAAMAIERAESLLMEARHALVRSFVTSLK